MMKDEKDIILPICYVLDIILSNWFCTIWRGPLSPIFASRNRVEIAPDASVPPVFLLCSSCVPPPPEESPDWPSVECLGPG